MDKRNLKYGGFAAVITVLVIIAVLAVNILATYIENTNGLKVDFTPQNSYTLDSNATTAINDLDKDVMIYTFIPTGTPSSYSGMTENIVKLFDGASGKITSQNVDPIVNPSKLEQFSTNTKELSSYAVVVAQKDDETNFHAFNENELVEYNSRTSKNYFVLQRWITSALIYLRTGVRQNVYILTGHGEKLDGDTETLINRIKRENYNVEEIDLLKSTLKQGDILIVLEPKSDISKEEYDSIISFLDDSYGRMMFIASHLTDDAGEKLKNYNNLLDYFNISMDNGVVAETDNNHRGAGSAKLIELAADRDHDISAAVRSANEPVWVSEATGFSYKYGTGVTVGTYTETFSGVLTSYASSVLVPWKNADDFKAADYEKGVHNIACAYQRVNEGITGTIATTATRILLFGSETLASGDYLGNSNIVRNGINWLAGRESADTLVNLGIDLTSSYVQMTKTQMNVWFTVLVACVPAAIMVLGIIVWIRRKNL